MANVSTKGQGTWQAMIRVWVAKEGTWKRAWRTTGLAATEPKEKAEKMADALQSAANSAGPESPKRSDRRFFVKMIEDIWKTAGLDVPAVSSSWNQFYPEYLAELEATDKSKAGYRAQFEAFAVHLGAKADAMLWDVGHKDCQSFYAHLMGEGRSHGTARNYLKAIRAVFARAVLMGVAPTNPALLVKLPNIRKVDKKPFEKEDIRAILAYLDNPAEDDLHMRRKAHEWRIVVRLGLYCGMRLGDATGRDWKDFDLKKGTVTFLPSKKARRGKVVTLPLLPPLLKCLREAGAGTAEGPVTPSLAADTKCSHYFGKMLERAGVSEPVAHALPKGQRSKEHTVREKSFHSLRHTVLTELARTGADKQLRQLLADHDDPRVNDKYTHAEVERLAGALALAFPE